MGALLARGKLARIYRRQSKHGCAIALLQRGRVDLSRRATNQPSACITLLLKGVPMTKVEHMMTAAARPLQRVVMHRLSINGTVYQRAVRFRLVGRGHGEKGAGFRLPVICALGNSSRLTRNGETNGSGGPPVKRARGIWPRGITPKLCGAKRPHQRRVRQHWRKHGRVLGFR